MEKYLCSICGYVELKDGAPDNCPVCGAPKNKFKETENAIKEPEDKENLTDLEKKHIPLMFVNKSCSLIEGCVDLHVKMGAILHPMEKAHYITTIDFYLNKEFISRSHLTPENLQPAGCLHLKATEGELSAVDHCNLHGNWIAEKEL
ncbi:MAG: desulfoferrodoxin family protein [Elusimicrobia bacterium]|jgi:superoxide reductase|nr:desulfoferrodoxin family protein [Elusimicrobiota bacterium]